MDRIYAILFSSTPFWFSDPVRGNYVAFCIILFGLTFTLSGCNPTQFEDLDNGEDSPKVKQSLAGIADDGLKISFIEVMGDSIPELRMEMKTVRLMPCSNYFIRVNLEDEYQNNIFTRKLSLTEIDRASVCFTATGPAVTRVPFDDLEDDLSVIIKDGEYRDNLTIFISDEMVEIISKETEFLELEYDRFFRRPENSIYFRCGTKEESANLCEDFHNILLDKLNVEPFQFPGEGYIPYPDSSSGYHINHPTRFYRYQNENQFKQIGELLENFTREQIASEEGVSLSIINWLDEGYRSWQFELD